MRRHACVLGWLVSLPLMVALVPGAILAQGLDDLDDLDEDVVTEQPFIPGIEVGHWEVTFMLGYLDLNQDLIKARQIIIDWNQGDTIYADMKLTGQSSFSPQLRLGRNLQWFTIELGLGLALGDYRQSVANLSWRPVDSDEPFTENDIEKGSYFVWYYDGNLTYNIKKTGRVIPYVTGGIGGQSYSLDSSYIYGLSTGMTYNAGIGFRVIGDELFQFRLEVRNYWSEIQFHSNANFRENQVNPEADDELINIPTTALDEDGNVIPFGGFEPTKFSSLYISLGVVASF